MESLVLKKVQKFIDGYLVASSRRIQPHCQKSRDVVWIVLAAVEVNEKCSRCLRVTLPLQLTLILFDQRSFTDAPGSCDSKAYIALVEKFVRFDAPSEEHSAFNRMQVIIGDQALQGNLRPQQLFQA